MRLLAKVITVSSAAAGGDRVDASGPAVTKLLEGHGFAVVDHALVPDGVDTVGVTLRMMTEEFHGLVVTSGGSGFAPDDLTPEATASIIERDAGGLAEAMHAVSPMGRLSRGRAGIAGRAIVINLPGSAKGAEEQLSAVIEILPHALELLGGGRPH